MRRVCVEWVSEHGVLDPVIGERLMADGVDEVGNLVRFRRPEKGEGGVAVVWQPPIDDTTIAESLGNPSDW